MREGTVRLGQTTIASCTATWVRAPRGRVQAFLRLRPAAGVSLTPAPPKPKHPSKKPKGDQLVGRWQVKALKPGTWELLCCIRMSGKEPFCGAMPGSLWVRPGKPKSFAVSLLQSPSAKADVGRRWLRTGRRFQLRWRLRDEAGAPTLPPHASGLVIKLIQPALRGLLWPVASSDLVRIFSREGDGLVFHRDGLFTLSIAPKGYPTLAKTLQVRVDGTPPNLVVQTPARGALLPQGQILTVTGTVNDTGSGLRAVTLNGNPLKLRSDGVFVARLPCRWGVQLIELIAVDNAGNQSQTQRSIRCYTRQALRPPARKKKSHPTASLQLRIAQRALDDNQRQSLNDIASILQRSLRQMKLDAVIPKRLAAGKVGLTRWGPYMRYVIQKGGVFQLKDTTFSIALLQQAIGLQLQLFGLALPLDIKAGVIKQMPKVIAPMLRFDLRIGLDLDDGKLKLKVLRSSNDASKLRILGLKGAVGLLRGIIESSVRKRLQKGLRGLLQERLFPVLRRLLLSFRLRKSWRPRQVLGKKRLQPLSFQSTVAKIQISPRSLQLGFSAAIKGHTPTFYPQFAFPKAPGGAIAWPDAGIAVAISLKTINQLLLSMWQVGLLRLDLTKTLRKQLAVLPALPIALPLPSLQISFAQPPVLMPGAGESAFRLVLGDMRIKLGLNEPGGAPKGPGWEIDARLHLVAGFQFVSTSQGMTVALAPQPEQLSIEIQSLKQPYSRGDRRLLPAEMAAGIEQIVQAVMPRVAGALLRFVPLPNQKAIKLPPKIQRWVPPLRVQPRIIAYRDGYVLVAFDLR